MTPDSTVPSDTDRLAEIRARLDAAGATPWHRYSTEFRGQVSHSVKSIAGSVVAHTGYGPLGGSSQVNAEFMADAPADIAYLLAENERLQGRLDTAEGQLATARHRHRAYPDAANPHAYCLSCRTGRKEVGSDFPEYMAWPCPDAIDLGLGEGDGQ